MKQLTMIVLAMLSATTLLASNNFYGAEAAASASPNKHQVKERGDDDFLSNLYSPKYQNQEYSPPSWQLQGRGNIPSSSSGHSSYNNNNNYYNSPPHQPQHQKSNPNDNDESRTWQRRHPGRMTCRYYPGMCRGGWSPGPDCCQHRCVDLKRDHENCGACGHMCNYSEICCNGRCVNPMHDRNHCGWCGNKCKKGGRCYYGMCSYA